MRAAGRRQKSGRGFSRDLTAVWKTAKRDLPLPMKMRTALLTLLAGANVWAGPVVVISRPAPTATVVSPLTPPNAQAGQSLLNQINNTLAQRRFRHEIVTTNAILRARTPAFAPSRR